MTDRASSWQDVREISSEYIERDQPAGYPEPAMTPERLRRGAGAPPAPGGPHAVAIRLFLGHIRDEDARLVHGTILVCNERRSHAWIEVPEHLIWDGGTRRFYDRAAWTTCLDPSIDQTYGRTEAARRLLATSDPGPWQGDCEDSESPLP